MAVGPDLNRFEVYTISAGEFYDLYRRTRVAFCDDEEIFGSRNYHYSLYWNVEDKQRMGFSKLYLRVFTKRGLENMREEIYEKIRLKMKNSFGIDTEDVMDNNLVVIAKDRVDSGWVSNTSLSVHFAPPKEKPKGEEVDVNKEA